MSSNIDYTVTTNKNVHDAAGELQKLLEKSGYGILSTIDVQKILMEKNNQSIEPYLILDVCHPQRAGEAIGKHLDAGLVLPCKISVYSEKGVTRISLLRPTEAIGLTGFSDLGELAGSVEAELQKTIKSMKE